MTMKIEEIDWLAEAHEGEVVDIGQIPDKQKAALKRAVRRGEIAAGKGGPFPKIKTCYGPLGSDFAGKRTMDVRRMLALDSLYSALGLQP